MSVSAILAVGLLFDPNDYKSELSRLVEEKTGRSFLIEDDLELTFFPWLSIQTGGLHLGNIEGFGEENFASIESLTARVRLLPLIQRRVEIGTIELDGLELNLTRNQVDLMSWENLLTPTSNNNSNSTARLTENSPLIQDLNIAGLSIRDGIIFWRENLTEVKYVLSDLSLDTGPIIINEPIEASLEFQLVSVDPIFSTTLDATSTISFNLNRQDYSANNLELSFRIEDGQHDERAVGQLQANIELSTERNSIQISDAQIQADLIDPPLGPENLEIQANTEQVLFGLETRTIEATDISTIIGGITTNWQLSEISLIDNLRLAGRAHIVEASVENLLNITEIDLESDTDFGNFDLSTRFSMEIESGNFYIDEMQGTALGIGFESAFSSTAGETNGNIQTTAFNPSTLITLLPPDTLEHANLSNIDSLILNTEFFIGANQVFSLRNFSATIPGAKITGALDRLENGGRLRGRLQTSEISPDLFITLFPNFLPESFGPDELGTVNLTTTFDYSSQNNLLRLGDFNANAIGLRTTGNLTLQNLPDFPEITGNVEVEEFSPRNLLERLGKELPTRSSSSVLSAATISTILTVNPEKGRLEGIRMLLDDTNITGELSIENFSDPKYSFNLIMDELDFDQYLTPIENGEDINSNNESKVDDLLLPTEALSLISIQGHLAVSELKAAGLRFSNVSTDLSIENGIARVDSSHADFYGGELDGGIELDGRAGASLLSLHGSGDSIELAPMMTNLSGEASVSGTGNLEFELNGDGKSLYDSLTNASGHFNFLVQNGAIQGFNLNHALCDAFNRLRDHPRPPTNTEQLTEFILLSGNSQVNDGIASTNDLLATTSNLKITAQGRMDLASKNINYDIDAEMIEAISIPQCNTLDDAVGNSIPLKLSGTAMEPIILPDFGELLLREAQEVIQDVIRDKILERLLSN